MNLIDERLKWRSEYEEGKWPDVYSLKQYRHFRMTNDWRSSRNVEKLCEYILYLEDIVHNGTSEERN